MNEVQLSLNDKSHGAFFIQENGQQLGEMVLSVSKEAVTVYHTEVAPGAEGKGLAKKLLDAMVAYAREKHLQVVPLCPYVLAQFKRHPTDYADLWMQSEGKEIL